ncbi:MAG: HlyC/CorC family transporter [Ardenticatenales bacterium]|nr:HlyC/CorC family transporter [Ardenticatenales bacterium]
MELLVSFLIIALLLLLNALFVAAEFAIIGVRPSRVEQLAQEGNRTAIGIREVVRTPGKQDRYIATAQLGITLASLGLGMYGEPVIAHILEGPLHDQFGLSGTIVHTISFIVALSIMTYLHVVIGEMVPKSLALQNAERTVLLLALPMAIMQTIFSWAITILNKIGLFVLWLLRVPPPTKGSRLHTPDELELIVSESYAGGMLDAEEQQLISNIFDFSERRVGQVMTPRPRMEAIDVTASEAEVMECMMESTYSRLPVYETNLDNILGILHLKDLVRQRVHGEPFNLRTLLRRAPLVPESLLVEVLLASLKRLHLHMAIVIDEYGGTAGIVTLEDLVEEIVGEVRDEFDTDEEVPIVAVEPGHLIVQGSVPLDELEAYVEIGEVEHDVETVGGLLLAEINRPPAVGDEVVVNGVILRVEAVEGLAIERLSLRFTPQPEEEEREAH